MSSGEDTGSSGSGTKGGGKGSGAGTDEFGGGSSTGSNYAQDLGYSGQMGPAPDPSTYYNTSSTGGGDPFGGGGSTDVLSGGGGGGGYYDTSATGGGDPFGGGGGTGYDSGLNLGGPGPVGGDSGLPGAGGGTNTPGGLPSSFLNANAGPIAAGGTTSVGGNAGNFSLDDIIGGTAGNNTGITDAGATSPAAPGGTGAAALAAPAGVSGLPDISLSSGDTDIFDAGGRTRDGGASATRAVTDDNGLLRSLGINSNNGLGVAAAGAGLLNNLVNGRGDTQSVDALRALAGQAAQQSADIRARSAPNQAVGGQTQQAGMEQITQGQSMTREGQALQQYVQTGTLPAAYESQIQQGVQAAITRAISNAATRGAPTDPTRNSTLAEEIRQIEARAPEMRMQMAQSLANTGNSVVGAGNQTISGGGSLVNTGTQTANSLIDEGLRSTGISSQIYQTLAGIDAATQQRRGSAIANFASALNSSPRRAA